jgi:shikimate dehydrogenase
VTIGDLFHDPLPYAEVIGDPIYQSKSPLIHGFWLEKLGLNAEYRATRVRADGLAAHLEKRRADPDWRGCNVTIPHKQDILAKIDFPLPTARRVGAAPSRAVVVEDAIAGVEAGRAGRFECVIGVDRRGQAQALRDANPALAVNDAAQMCQLLSAEYGDDLVGLFNASDHGRAMHAAGFDDDLHTCASVDLFPVLAEYRDRAIVARTAGVTGAGD